MTPSTPRHALPGLAIAALLLVAPSSGWSTMYKWTDADGRVVYSDQPPPDRKVDKVLKRAPPPDPAAARQLADIEAALRERQQARDDEARKADKQATDTKARAEECAKVRSHLELLKGETRLYRVDDKGQQVFLDDSARRKATDDATALLRQKCG